MTMETRRNVKSMLIEYFQEVLSGKWNYLFNLIIARIAVSTRGRQPIEGKV